MCTIAAAAVGMGVLQTGAGIMQANAQYKAAHQQAQRQNQIAQQNYNNQLRVAHQNDAAKKKHFEQQLEANQAAITAAQKQERMNQVEANRANAEIALEKRTVAAKAAFESQEKLADMIQNTGTMLSTGNVGQSFLLQTMQAERELGFKQAQVQESLYNSNVVAAMENQGVHLKQFGADSAAFNRVGAAPVAERPSFLPYKPIKVQGPSRGALMGAMIGAAAGGAATGFSTYGSMVDSGFYNPDTKKYC